ncbi:biopolymer transporter ExbD [candidate division TA06 bacterium]|uniref:Biopolymer transporter ExbD n=1 Tax=candidate division TA06 bacterium TaxID=2250710 RepID=A0A523UQB0_UNCT6|nr:MAG: biopolymer transporter ExbD [candidate division TA06 bacterium]
MELRKRARAEAVIPTASMADIAFLLIIFFMTTTIFATEAGLTMVLPEPGEEVKIKKQNILTVLVNKDGIIKISGEPVPLDDVQALIEQKLAENDSLVVSLKTARECRYGRMIQVFDKLKLAKAERISFAPAPKSKR